MLVKGYLLFKLQIARMCLCQLALGSERHFNWLEWLGSYMALGPFHDAIICGLRCRYGPQFMML
jgi:hypothetical protein